MVDYREDFPQRLIAHMADGMTLKGFAAELGCHERTLRKWAKDHPEFSEAKEIGRCAMEAYLIRLGKRIASGNLVRVAREEPILDKRGNPILDSSGKPAVKRFFIPTQGNAAVWIFMMKNQCGWRNEPRVSVKVNQSQQQGIGVRNDIQAMSDAELSAAIEASEQTLRLAQKKVPDGPAKSTNRSGKAVPVKRRGRPPKSKV
jgi:hypothetical protein